MLRRQCKDRYDRILCDLDLLRSEWQQDAKTTASDKAPARREQFKLLESETAVLRLMQAERRLFQQILLGLGGFASGSLITLLVKHWLGG